MFEPLGRVQVSALSIIKSDMFSAHHSARNSIVFVLFHIYTALNNVFIYFLYGSMQNIRDV